MKVYAVCSHVANMAGEDKVSFYGFFASVKDALNFVEEAGSPPLMSSFDERLFVRETEKELCLSLGISENPRQLHVQYNSAGYAYY